METKSESSCIASVPVGKKKADELKVSVKVLMLLQVGSCGTLMVPVVVLGSWASSVFMFFRVMKKGSVPIMV